MRLSEIAVQVSASVADPQRIRGRDCNDLVTHPRVTPEVPMTDPDPACELLGIQVEEVTAGRAVLRLRLTEAMANRHGTGHGGVLFLLADAAFAHASNSYGPVAVAQAAQITFLRPAEIGTTVWAEAVERVRQGRFGIYDVTVRQSGGAPLAELRGHSMLLTAAPLTAAPLSGTTPTTATATDGGPHGSNS
jgi:phenylacetic acid degradation protein PaaD